MTFKESEGDIDSALPNKQSQPCLESQRGMLCSDSLFCAYGIPQIINSVSQNYNIYYQRKIDY